VNVISRKPASLAHSRAKPNPWCFSFDLSPTVLMIHVKSKDATAAIKIRPEKQLLLGHMGQGPKKAKGAAKSIKSKISFFNKGAKKKGNIKDKYKLVLRTQEERDRLIVHLTRASAGGMGGGSTLVVKTDRAKQINTKRFTTRFGKTKRS
jgi:hypothetical protein